MNRTRAEFLLTDAQIGLTLLDIARTRRDPLAARVTLNRAREALDMINRHLAMLQLDATLRAALEEARDELEIRPHETQRQLSEGSA